MFYNFYWYLDLHKPTSIPFLPKGLSCDDAGLFLWLSLLVDLGTVLRN